MVLGKAGNYSCKCYGKPAISRISIHLHVLQCEVRVINVGFQLDKELKLSDFVNLTNNYFQSLQCLRFLVSDSHHSKDSASNSPVYYCKKVALIQHPQIFLIK